MTSTGKLHNCDFRRLIKKSLAFRERRGIERTGFTILLCLVGQHNISA